MSVNFPCRCLVTLLMLGFMSNFLLPVLAVSHNSLLLRTLLIIVVGVILQCKNRSFGSETFDSDRNWERVIKVLAYQCIVFYTIHNDDKVISISHNHQLNNLSNTQILSAQFSYTAGNTSIISRVRFWLLPASWWGVLYGTQKCDIPCKAARDKFF